MLKELERRVEETAGAVAHWQQNKARIETSIADATARRAKAASVRKAVALDASLGNPKAIADLAQARAEHAAATGDLADLGDAQNDAAPKLAEAEAADLSARAALSHYHTGLLKRRRIGVTKQIDTVLVTALLPLIEELDDLGEQIANATPQAPSMFGTSNIGALAEIVGDRRLRAALEKHFGKRFEKIFPGALYDEKRKESLFDSETRIWNLPPEQPIDKAA